MTERGRQGKIFHPLIHSPKGHNDCDEARLRQEPEIPSGSSTWVAGPRSLSHHPLHSQAHYEGAGSEAEQLEFEQVRYTVRQCHNSLPIGLPMLALSFSYFGYIHTHSYRTEMKIKSQHV